MNSSDQAPSKDSFQREIPPEHWQALQARWKSILGVEAGIENMRLRMESLRAELEAAARQPLGIQEKTYALQSDMAQWNKAKNRVHYALPKLREFVHRATWALGIPERKKLEEIFKSYIEPQIPFPELAQVPEQLEGLLKERQILAAQGATVDQECRGISGEIQRALSALQRNARERARKKMDSTRTKGKYL